MKLILQTANVAGDEKNCLYPNRAEISSAEELQVAVRMDHVCAEYDTNYRSKENFRQSNVVVMDCDNDHTENPAEWITPEKLDEMMPDISYAIAFSRYHLLPKNGKAPRPKFHVYFEIEPTQDADYYAALKEAIYRKYPFFDDNALDAARFIFGADVGDAVWHEGWLTIESEVEVGAPADEKETGRIGNVIIEGTRNKTMDYLTKCTNASPGEAGKDLWLDTVRRVFCGDADLIDYVQTIVGMAVMGKVFSEALIISYGDGANGKSTFWNTLARVLGNYSGMMSADALTVGCKRNVKPEMAELKGKRLIIAAELEEGMRLNTSTVKQICVITGRELR